MLGDEPVICRLTCSTRGRTLAPKIAADVGPAIRPIPQLLAAVARRRNNGFSGPIDDDGVVFTIDPDRATRIEDPAIALAMWATIANLTTLEAVWEEDRIQQVPKYVVFHGRVAGDGSLLPTGQGLQLAQALPPQYHLLMAEEDARAAALTGREVWGFKDTKELDYWLAGIWPKSPVQPPNVEDAAPPSLTFEDIIGQSALKFALTVCAAGGHHLLAIGPPGEGKSAAIHALPAILPPLSADEALETTAIHAQRGLIKGGKLIGQPPFRRVTGNASVESLIGSGSGGLLAPGECSLAHNGVMFLDEAPDLAASRNKIEALRVPLQDRVCTVTRASVSATFPARFTLVATGNPCECGYWGSARQACRCTGYRRVAYLGRFSGPILDRIDIRMWVPELSAEQKVGGDHGETWPTTEQAREMVRVARVAQRRRYEATDFRLNSDVDAAAVYVHTIMDGAARVRAAEFADQVSGRAYHKLLKLGRTVADYRGHENVAVEDFDAAIGLWQMEEVPWL